MVGSECFWWLFVCLQRYSWKKCSCLLVDDCLAVKVSQQQAICALLAVLHKILFFLSNPVDYYYDCCMQVGSLKFAQMNKPKAHRLSNCLKFFTRHCRVIVGHCWCQLYLVCRNRGNDCSSQLEMSQGSDLKNWMVVITRS